MKPTSQSQEKAQTEQPITPQNKRVDDVKSVIWTFVKSGTIITLGLIILSLAEYRYNLHNRIGNIFANQIYAGLIGTFGTTALTIWAGKEKRRVEEAQSRALANTQSIEKVRSEFLNLVKELAGQTDSVMIQIAAINSEIKKLNAKSTSLENESRKIDEKIDVNRQKLLKERSELLKTFYEEILELKESIAYLKGVNDASNTISMEDVNEIIKSVAERINRD